MRLLLILALLISIPVSAQIYKCEGEDGETIFSQRPCSDEAETVDVGPTNSSAPPSEEAKRIYDKNALERRFDQIDRQYERDLRDIDKRACQRARDDVADAKERWRDAKRNGYTPSQQRYYEQSISDAERYANTTCS